MNKNQFAKTRYTRLLPKKLYADHESLYSQPFHHQSFLAEFGAILADIENHELARNRKKKSSLKGLTMGDFYFSASDTKDISSKATHFIQPSLYKKIKLGQCNIENKIDFHGLLVNEAYQALVDFIKNSFLEGYRLLLIITGKGDHEQSGAIKKNLLSWINGNRELKQLIVFIDKANIKHGGDGAFYCYLKSNRRMIFKSKDAF